MSPRIHWQPCTEMVTLTFGSTAAYQAIELPNPGTPATIGSPKLLNLGTPPQLAAQKLPSPPVFS